MVSKFIGLLNRREALTLASRHLGGRALSGALLLVLAAQANAGDGIFGTKSSPVATTSSNSGSGISPMPIAQMFVALLIVLALLKWILPMATKKFVNRNAVSSKTIRVQETASVGPANLFVVDVRGRSFLLGATSASVCCLADVTETRSAELPTFQEMVDAAPAKSTFAETSIADALEQLNRLKRLGS